MILFGIFPTPLLSFFNTAFDGDHDRFRWKVTLEAGTGC